LKTKKYYFVLSIKINNKIDIYYINKYNLYNKNMENELEDMKKKYIKSLNEIELIALIIAEENLESSFCLEKSIGFLNFIKSFNDER
tara:strand:- start:39152 stop:39412 length:261 start_codon:yes stop_codon:yes gene_type:complete